MKKAGIIGGMGPESTVEYYKGINKRFQQLTGNPESFPNFTLESIDIFRMLAFCARKDYLGLTNFLLKAVDTVTKAGADFAALAANTPHIVFQQVQEQASIPLISIIDATCERVCEQNISRVGLLGTKFTMAEDFFKAPFVKHSIQIVVPLPQEIEVINERIVNELEHGIFRNETKDLFLDIVNKMVATEKIEGLILGCTELPLLISPSDLQIACFDTMKIHIDSIVKHIAEL